MRKLTLLLLTFLISLSVFGQNTEIQGVVFTYYGDGTARFMCSTTTVMPENVVIPEEIQLNGQTLTVVNGYLGNDQCVANLKTLSLPKTLEQISIYANASQLTAITIAEGCETYSSYDGVLYENTGYFTTFNEATQQYDYEQQTADYLVLNYIPQGKTRTLQVPSTTRELRRASNATNNISSYVVDANNPYFTSQDGVVFSKDMKTMSVYPAKKTSAEYVVPEGTQTLNAFNNNYLQKLTIASTVNYMNQTFMECNSLNTLNVLPLTPPGGDLALETYSQIDATFPASAIDAYAASKVWRSFFLNGENIKVGPYLYDFYSNHTCIMKDIVETISGDITLPATVSYNGENYAFKEINYARTSQYIGDQFVTDVTSLVIPEGVTILEDVYFNAFQHVKTITIPSTVTRLRYNAFLFGLGGGYQSPDFDYSTGINNTYYDLEHIVINTDKLNYKDIDGVLYSQDGKTLLICPRGRQGEYTIPDGVERIEDYGFRACNKLTKITIPSSVKEIGTNPVRYSEDESQWSFDTAGGSVFTWCNQLKELNLPDVEYISTGLLRSAWSLEKFVLPSTVKFIGYNSFSLLSGLKTFDWNNSHLEGIGNGAFSFSNIILTEIPKYTLELPMHVKYIDDNAFSYCLAPESINLSPDLEYLGRQFISFFSENSNATTSEKLAPLKAIYNYRSEPLDVADNIFGYDTRREGRQTINEFPQAWADECVLYVPIGTSAAYKAHDIWGRFKHIEEFDATLPEESGITEIKSNMGSSLHVYDLMGRSVKVDQMKHGIYIINGRKVMMP